MDLELLSRVATRPFEECEAEWKEVLRGLRLGMIYVPAIQRVLAEGRWKDAPNPAAYVRKGARRLAARLGIVERRPRPDREVLACELRYQDEQGQELGHDDRLGTALHRHREKYGRGYGADAHAAEGRLPAEVYGEDMDIDWEHAGDLAALDGGERLVVELKQAGFSRETALRACLKDEDRRYLQAAWKRFYRDRGRFSRALLTGKPRRARKEQTEWPELELCLVETEEGELKISFKNKVVPEGRV
jgi:hypothetical protein